MTTAFTTVKIALLAPMPSASVAIATAAKPGDRTRPRHANRQTSIRLSIMIAAESQSMRHADRPRELKIQAQKAHTACEPHGFRDSGLRNRTIHTAAKKPEGR